MIIDDVIVIIKQSCGLDNSQYFFRMGAAYIIGHVWKCWAKVLVTLVYNWVNFKLINF